MLSWGLWVCVPAWGQPSVPWSPSPIGRHALELLVDEAGLDLITSHWPLPWAAVSRAIDRLPAELPPALNAARQTVKSELQASRGSQLTLTARNRAEALPGFGDDPTPGGSIDVRSSVLDGPYLAFQIGGRTEVRANADVSGLKVRLDDSAVATEALGLQLHAWSHRSWWGPGWQSALQLSSNAPALTAVGLQRASASTSESPWLSWLGPWSFELFMAQTEDVADPANPFLLGNRLTLRPFSHLEIGISRTIQWGGRGRRASLGSLLRLNIGAYTNAETIDGQNQDPGNQMAGFDFRLRCPAGLNCAVYGQGAGEDEANYLPSNYLGMYGMEFWAADGTQRFFAEYAETGCRTPIGRPPEKGCAYRNFAYPGGYVNAGRWIGASAGPDSRLYTLGWLGAATDTSVRLTVGGVGSRIGTYSPLVDDPRYSGRLLALSAKQGFQWGGATITPELDLTRLRAPAGTFTDVRVGASLRMNLDSAFQTTRSTLGASLAGPESTPWTQLLVGAGLIAGSALFDNQGDEYAQRHGNNPSTDALRNVGNALPFVGAGLAGAAWLSQRGSTQGDVGFSAAAAGVSAVAATEVLKFAVSRSRPTQNLGASSFSESQQSERSFPSGHSALAWAVVTPYAMHYDAPWLYGLAALTNAARVMGRDHWVSDTVAGAALGYWLGRQFYDHSGASTNRPAAPRLSITPRSVVLAIPFE